MGAPSLPRRVTGFRWRAIRLSSSSFAAGVIAGAVLVGAVWAVTALADPDDSQTRPTVGAPASVSPSSHPDDQPERAVALGVLDPCTMVPADELIALGYTEQQAFAVEPTRSCVFTAPGSPRTLTVTLADDGISELRPEEGAVAVDSPTIGDRRAARLRSLTEPLCTVVLEVGDDHTASVQIRDTDVHLACYRASVLAEVIEPLLPLS